ncbi:6-hydroxy-d-nicotine oxidase [Fusarium longipes]|uniref:6-hydroxy-d-nicotine oxidase n=1 Tax=Fusarium longipes TaxID=694270 RepID=A0A395T0E3_9HYPO|nr:6-hydroxy-d-nicotine oxidase [Fusarium longipes]
MNWHATLTLVLTLVGLVSASCSGKSDACSSNPIQVQRINELNFQPESCNLKWKFGCKKPDEHGGFIQKPPPFPLCTTWDFPSGLLPVDAYTLSLQNNTFSKGSASVTLHGLWPGSVGGHESKNQPYGCLNGEEFDETILKTFADLLQHFWPTDPEYKNTMQCFILSEWMKHGTCAVIPGADGEAFRLSQEAYFRTVFVLINEFNENKVLRERLKTPTPMKEMDPLITTRCVQCAYFATVGWEKTDLASVPRMSSDCIDTCFACGNDWDRCPPAQLDSNVELDPSNAPSKESGSHDIDGDVSFQVLEFAVPGLVDSDNISPWKGTWRSFGAEQLGSGKFEFAQTFTDKTMTVTTDSPYPQTCKYERRGPGELVLRCGKDDSHLEECLVQRLPDIGGLEAAFLACNHTGAPSPGSFFTAMDTLGCGNFLMFRCKASAAGCYFSPDGISADGSQLSKSKKKAEPNWKRSYISQSYSGIAGSPPKLLGSWRSLQVSKDYEKGLARWNFTADGQASLEWPNYPNRGVQRYSVSHAQEDHSRVILTDASGTVTNCRFKFQYQPVYSYATLDCGAPNELAGDKKSAKHTQWAMGRCNPCSASCRYSCNAENDMCGTGSCDPDESTETKRANNIPSLPVKDGHNWCTPEDSSCWPTERAIFDLEQALDPTVPRLGLRWSSYPQPQPAPVPLGSIKNQSFYGLGDEGLRALYYYKDINEMQRPCFSASGDFTALNDASDMCKAALHQNEYRNWNPFIVVFPLNERHVAAALKFAAQHRLCIATAGTGHEYNSRNSCPTGGILIRTILLKDKVFMETWDQDPTIAPAGAFRFGAGSIFAEMHNFSAKYDRAIASGWCSTVGMVGFHLGGGHGPFAPSMGLGVDNLLEIEVLQVGSDAYDNPVVHKKVASRHQNPQLFWAMRGGGGGVWGVILSMTLRAHKVPEGGLSRVYITQKGNFCPGSQAFGYEWLRDMWDRFTAWQLKLNHKVSTQPAFFINTGNYTNGDLCKVTWNFNFEYFYAGGQTEKEYKMFRDGLKDVLQNYTAQEDNYDSAYKYLLSMPANKFSINATNPLPASSPPSDSATGSQNSVLVSRQMMETKFASTMMDVLDICVETLKTPDKTSPDPAGYRCGFHYLYTSMTGNLGSVQPKDTAISAGFRSALMLWNARTLTTQQADDTIYKLGPNSYFSESSYVMHNWTTRYWGEKKYGQLLAVKKAHDPKNLFWCHHCVGDNPKDAYGEPLGAVSGGQEDQEEDEVRDEL